MHIFLETERLVLRRFTEADADSLIELDSDPAVMRFLTGGKPTPRDVIRGQTLPQILDSYERWAGLGSWAAIEKPSGQFLGWFALRRSGDRGQDEAELGYRLRRSAWGKGYATEGARALIRKGFTELDLNLVWAETMAVNQASRRVMEKAGLSFVRVSHLTWEHPIEGTEHGEVEYALRKEEWERQQAATDTTPGVGSQPPSTGVQ